MIERALYIIVGFCAALLWLTCSYEPEPRVGAVAAYQLALDAGLLHDVDAR